VTDCSSLALVATLIGTVYYGESVGSSCSLYCELELIFLNFGVCSVEPAN
jgi:hypothetical protein